MIGKIYEENTKSIPSMKEAYIKWINEEEWTFFSTLTTRYELTQKSARRAAELGVTEQDIEIVSMELPAPQPPILEGSIQEVQFIQRLIKN